MKKIILFVFILFSLTLQAFSLKDGFKLALENDMDSKVNENNLKNIKYDQDIADSLLYPKVDLNASVQTTKTTQNQATPSNDGTNTQSDQYTLTITQPLFDGFESKYEKRIQKNAYKSAVYYLKQSQGTVAINYTSAYIEALRQKDLLNLAVERVNISENIFNKVYKKVSSGYGTKLEYEEVKSYLLESKVNLNTQRINLKEALENLKFYVQTDFDSSELVKPTFYTQLPKTLDDAVQTALKNNPAINVAKVNVDVAVAQEKKTNKEFYPTVDFVSTYRLNNAIHAQPDSDNNEFTVGVELNYNLYNGGKNTAETKKALQNIREKKYLVKKNQFQVKNKMRLAWNNYKLNKEKNETLRQFVVVKKDVLDASLKEFDLGLKTLNSILDTYYVDYIDAKRDLISNTYDLINAKYSVLDSMGKLSDALLGKLPTLGKTDTSFSLKELDNEDYRYNDDKALETKKIKKIIPRDDLDLKPKKDIYQNNKPKIEKVVFTNVYENKKEQSFKERFLSASKDKYTINLALSTSQKKAQEFLDKYNLNQEAFYFSFRKVDPLQKIMMGVYNSKKEAKKIIENLNKQLKENKPRVEKISIKQNLYHKYHGYEKYDGIKTFPKKELVLNEGYHISNVSFSTSQNEKFNDIEKSNFSFKDEFLSASKDKYTINLALSNSEKKAQRFLEKNNIEDKAFFFKFGYEKPLQKVVYGVFDSKEKAKKALENLSANLRRNRPIVEKISKKQKLFYKYNRYTFSSKGIGSI